MKKTVLVFVLSVIIVATFSLIILWTMANGSENNFFNLKYRPVFASQEWLRTLFKLQSDGDAKSDYLGTHYAKITIEVDEMQGLSIPTKALDLLSQKIFAVTGKETNYALSDQNIPYQDSVTLDQVDQITKQYRNYFNGGGSASIYLMVLSRDQSQADELGVTYNNFGIVLFAQAIEGATASNPQTVSNYAESTALHEFGHQIGLKHNSQPGCLMQPVVEQGEIVRQRAGDVITDFCDYEKQQIKNNSL